MPTYENQFRNVETLEDLIIQLNKFLTWFTANLADSNIKRLRLTEGGQILLEGFKDTYGGILKIYDAAGNLNVKIGVESGGAGNVGGTLVLYNDRVGDPRVALGISGEQDAGIINLHDTDDNIRVSMKADDASTGPVIMIVDASGNVKTYFTMTVGYINNAKIATEAWVSTQINGDSGTFTTADGKTVTVSDGLITNIT